MRAAELTRKTKETDIYARLDLDSGSECDISTGIGFFDHMLTAFALHSGFGLTLKCKGDLEVDAHHTVEDIGIALGQVFGEAAADKTGLTRYGFFMLPMDESLAECALDISGRPYLVYNVPFRAESIGGLDTQLVREFFYAFAMNAKITLHINVPYGENDHHKCEAVFKSFAHAMRMAATKSGSTLLSTKGTL